MEKAAACLSTSTKLEFAIDLETANRPLRRKRPRFTRRGPARHSPTSHFNRTSVFYECPCELTETFR